MLTSMLMSETISLDDKSLKKSITEYNMFNIDLFVEREECNSKIRSLPAFFIKEGLRKPRKMLHYKVC